MVSGGGCRLPVGHGGSCSPPGITPTCSVCDCRSTSSQEATLGATSFAVHQCLHACCYARLLGGALAHLFSASASAAQCGPSSVSCYVGS